MALFRRFGCTRIESTVAWASVAGHEGEKEWNPRSAECYSCCAGGVVKLKLWLRLWLSLWLRLWLRLWLSLWLSDATFRVCHRAIFLCNPMRTDCILLYSRTGDKVYCSGKRTRETASGELGLVQETQRSA